MRAIGLDPTERSEAIHMTGKGSYIGEVLDTAFSSAQAVVVLQTSDDLTFSTRAHVCRGPRVQPTDAAPNCRPGHACHCPF